MHSEHQESQATSSTKCPLLPLGLFFFSSSRRKLPLRAYL